MNLCHAKDISKPLSTALLLLKQTLLYPALSVQENHVESLRPTQSKMERNKQDGKSPGPAETDSESVIQNSNEEQNTNEQTIDIKMQENGEAK